MSNYTKATNFTSKDTLAVGNPLKIIKGTEFDVEFNAIADAVATKANIADPTFSGVPAAPTATAGTNTTQLATTAFVTAAVTAYDTALTVSTAQIEDDAVTSAKIALGAVTNLELATDAVTQVKIANDAVTQVKIANDAVGTAEIINGNVTAAKLSGAQSGTAPIYGARAWVNFDGTGTIGTNQTIRASGNVASVFKNGTGDFTVTFSTAMPDANYVVLVSSDNTGTSAPNAFVDSATAPTTSAVRIGFTNNAGTRTENTQNFATVFR